MESIGGSNEAPQEATNTAETSAPAAAAVHVEIPVCFQPLESAGKTGSFKYADLSMHSFTIAEKQFLCEELTGVHHVLEPTWAQEPPTTVRGLGKRYEIPKASITRWLVCYKEGHSLEEVCEKRGRPPVIDAESFAKITNIAELAKARGELLTKEELTEIVTAESIATRKRRGCHTTSSDTVPEVSKKFIASVRTKLYPPPPRRNFKELFALSQGKDRLVLSDEDDEDEDDSTQAREGGGGKALPAASSAQKAKSKLTAIDVPLCFRPIRASTGEGKSGRRKLKFEETKNSTSGGPSSFSSASSSSGSSSYARAVAGAVAGVGSRANPNALAPRQPLPTPPAPAPMYLDLSDHKFTVEEKIFLCEELVGVHDLLQPTTKTLISSASMRPNKTGRGLADRYNISPTVVHNWCNSYIEGKTLTSERGRPRIMDEVSTGIIAGALQGAKAKNAPLSNKDLALIIADETVQTRKRRGEVVDETAPVTITKEYVKMIKRKLSSDEPKRQRVV